MNRIAPPTLAGWMLAHLVPGESNDPLAGDLREEFCAGRSAAWYWRQVLSAIAIRCVRELRTRRTAVFFSVLWSMLAPAWMLVFAEVERQARLNEHLAQMIWPWSAVCDLGLTLAASLLFLWTGILLYLFPDLWLTGNLRLRELIRGVAASVPALLVLWLALIALPKHFVAAETNAQVSASRAPTPLEAFRLRRYRIWTPRSSSEPAPAPLIEGNGSNIADAGPRNAIRHAMVDIRTPALLARLPFFLVVLCTLWRSTTRTRRCAS